MESALIMAGDQAFRRIATLAVVSGLISGRPAEILRMALMRACFRELAASLTPEDPSEHYLLGLFSLLRDGITKETAKFADRKAGVRFASTLAWIAHDLAEKIS